VTGPDRHQVTGLFARLEAVLTKRQAFRRLDPDSVAFALAVPLVVAGLLLGSNAARWLGLADDDGRLEVAEA